MTCCNYNATSLSEVCKCFNLESTTLGSKITTNNKTSSSAHKPAISAYEFLITLGPLL